MQIINVILNLILKFHEQILQQPTGLYEKGQSATNKSSGEFTKWASEVNKTYKHFQKLTHLLFEILTQLSAKGYNPYITQLRAQWNYNQFYDQRSPQNKNVIL